MLDQLGDTGAGNLGVKSSVQIALLVTALERYINPIDPSNTEHYDSWLSVDKSAYLKVNGRVANRLLASDNKERELFILRP